MTENAFSFSLSSLLPVLPSLWQNIYLMGLGCGASTSQAMLSSPGGKSEKLSALSEFAPGYVTVAGSTESGGRPKTPLSGLSCFYTP